MANDMKRLEKRERFLRDSLMNLAHLMETYHEDRDRIMLEGWRERLEGIFSEFTDARLQLECSDDYQTKLKESLDASAVEQSQQIGEEIDALSPEQVNQDARAEFEYTYLRIKGFIANKLQTHGTNLTITTNPGQTSNLRTRVKLPELKLPTFDGSIKEWPSFRDTFVSLIDSNLLLSDVDKFSYLVACLSKDAKRVIEVIEVTAGNYSVAWELLVRRYENRYLLVKSYVDSLFAIEPMKRECSESLSRLLDQFERNLKMLEKVGEVPAQWSTILLFMLSSRLDSATLRCWESHRKSSTVPTYTELVEFLRSHSLVLQSIAASNPRSTDNFRSSSSQHPSSHVAKKYATHSSFTLAFSVRGFSKTNTYTKVRAS